MMLALYITKQYFSSHCPWNFMLLVQLYI